MVEEKSEVEKIKYQGITEQMTNSNWDSNYEVLTLDRLKLILKDIRIKVNNTNRPFISIDQIP